VNPLKRLKRNGYVRGLIKCPRCGGTGLYNTNYPKQVVHELIKTPLGIIPTESCEPLKWKERAQARRSLRAAQEERM